MVKFKISLLFFSLILILSVVFVYAQEYGKETQDKQNSDTGETAAQETKLDKTNVNIGPGMEAITVDGTSILVPKDMIVTKEKGIITKEDMGAYLGRKFDEIGNRFDKIESNQEELKNELGQLKQRIEILEQQSSSKANVTQRK